MSDKTPESTGASERDSDALGNASDDQIDATGVEGASEPSDTAGRVGAGGRRRSSSAPVRRGASAVDPEANDMAIADLEDGFTAEEQSAASEMRRSRNAPVKKTTATRKRSETQKDEYDPYTASNPAQFVKQSASEIKKVVWPTWPQLTVLFLSVLIFVLFMIAFVGGLDMLFGWGLLATLGDS
ncbi:MAG: preprotein translocase subunit SecE [Propionibacteriaceae bacterium]|nr:preprotein translocase subunit SecE [Propionibacteriaceae bacterium]